jgi:hypothetical protein
VELEHTIDGKKVVLKARVPLRDSRNLLKLIGKKATNGMEVDDIPKLGAVLMESWEFPGSPAKAASYEDLDMFDVICPLMILLAQYLEDRMARMGSLKNSEGASPSQ